LWITDRDKEVLVSGMSVEPVLPQSRLKVELGKVESNGVSR